MIGVLIFWVGLSIAIGAAADARGRNGFGWFVLSLAISPLIAAIVLIANPSLKEAAPRVFRPDGVLAGIPYRKRPNGEIEAMMVGGLTVFQTIEQLTAAAEGKSIPAFSYPDEHFTDIFNGIPYRVEANGVVIAGVAGQVKHFRDWRTFWHAANTRY